MKKMLVSLILLSSSFTISHAESEYDLRSNMFYENHFWNERKLTEQELNQAIIFITEIMKEAKESRGHAVTYAADRLRNPTEQDIMTAYACDMYSSLSTAYSFYKSQVAYYPQFKKHTIPMEKIFDDLIAGKAEDGLPTLQECKILNYWMPHADVTEE
ncbi:hypothetical protein [Acinetobacter bohemicus]|uniref:hypothetical protein n=1 Tax=Acinetobacter bohemicus TaxID=1435036 RepID=UPI0040431758